MKYLSLEEILRLHFQIIQDFGGSHGVRDEGRLESLVAAPKQEVFGVEQYPDIYSKAAVYMRNVIGDHPFIDGNKRTAVIIAGIFMVRNGIKLTSKQKDLENFAVKIATDHLSVVEIAKWLEQNTTKS